MTIVTREFLDIGVIDGVKYLVGEADARLLIRRSVGLDSSIFFVSDLFHDLVIVPFPKPRAEAQVKRIDNIRLTRVVTQNQALTDGGSWLRGQE